MQLVLNVYILDIDSCIDLVIPRGSSALVNYIKSNTKIPVLGHADGICHIYVDNDVDINKAVSIVVESKVNYPSGTACRTGLDL